MKKYTCTWCGYDEIQLSQWPSFNKVKYCPKCNCNNYNTRKTKITKIKRTEKEINKDYQKTMQNLVKIFTESDVVRETFASYMGADFLNEFDYRRYRFPNIAGICEAAADRFISTLIFKFKK